MTELGDSLEVSLRPVSLSGPRGLTIRAQMPGVFLMGGLGQGWGQADGSVWAKTVRRLQVGTLKAGRAKRAECLQQGERQLIIRGHFRSCLEKLLVGPSQRS